MALKFEQNRAGPKLESQKLDPSIAMRHAEEHQYSLMFIDEASKAIAYRRMASERRVGFQFGQQLQVAEHAFDFLV